MGKENQISPQAIELFKKVVMYMRDRPPSAYVTFDFFRRYKFPYASRFRHIATEASEKGHTPQCLTVDTTKKVVIWNAIDAQGSPLPVPDVKTCHGCAYARPDRPTCMLGMPTPRAK